MPDNKRHRHVTLQFTHKEYEALQWAAKATYGDGRLGNIARFIEGIMGDVIADINADRAAEEIQAA